MAEKILVVEDEPTLLETLIFNLKREGYSVEGVTDGRTAVRIAREFQPDLIILDLMLPELEGFKVARILRQEMTIPILMLTARDEENDRVSSLEIDAEDYITKPFSMRELIARIKAHPRQVRIDMEKAATNKPKHDNQIELGNLL